MIGWYVHHHGWGHVTRLRAILPHLDDDATVFSSIRRPADLDERVTWVELPSDADPVVGSDGVARDARDLGDVTAGGALHWAPIGHPGHQARLATIAEWIARTDVSAFVVDVSVEVTAFVRLLGVPTVVFTQPGERTDAPHRLGFDLVDRIIAPWADGTIESRELAARGDTVVRVGGISRHDGRARPPHVETERRVLFLGRTLDSARLARSTDLLTADGWIVETAGAREDDRVDDVWPLLCGATVVVSAAGQNAIADLTAAGARAVILPQERPFDEQKATAGVLDGLGLAVAGSPDATPVEVVDLVRRAEESTPNWETWNVSGAAARAAAVIDEVRA